MITVKRLNPETGQPFRSGDVREDGFIFRRYNQQRKRPNGEFLEQWYRPETYKRHNDRDRKYMAARAAALRDELRDYKMKHGCVDCGYKAHFAAMEFDHRPGTEKLFNVNSKVAADAEKVWAEVAKCDVVCANCHQIRTHERLTKSVRPSTLLPQLSKDGLD